MSDFRRNHYVPKWFQYRFTNKTNGSLNYYRLDLRPRYSRNKKGRLLTYYSTRSLGPKKVYVKDDLYTVVFGNLANTRIEQTFFGEIDRKGSAALDYFENYNHRHIDYELFHDMVRFMSTQKLRTIKGLGWLKASTNSDSQAKLMQKLVEYENLFSSIWALSVWQIADASASPTKFIISDHPVTVYNRKIGPRHPTWSRGYNDPPINWVGTHTIFPLSLNKLLILTNLPWVHNPYQNPRGLLPNPGLMRPSVHNFQRTQIGRQLTETEVRQFNFIIKSRAYRYISAANKDWLYPERYIQKSDWAYFGNGYLCMPDPRAISGIGPSQYIFGRSDGKPGFAIDDYGFMPGQPGFEDSEGRTEKVRKTQERFQAEFARLFGKKRRGIAFEIGSESESEDSDQEFNRYIKQYESYLNRNKKTQK